MMRTLIGSFLHHPYAMGSLALACCAAIALAATPRHHRLSLLTSGGLSAPWAFSSVVFVPAYWRPDRLFDGAIGFEDIVFSLSTGVLAWALPHWPFPGGTSTLEVSVMGFRRLLMCWLVGSAACAALCLAGWRPMPATLVSIFLLGGGLVLLRRDLLGLCLRGALSFAAFYYIVLKAVLLVYPALAGQWNRAGLLGVWLTGLPLDEVLWAADFGAVWPVMMACCLAPVPQRSRAPAGSSGLAAASPGIAVSAD